MAFALGDRYEILKECGDGSFGSVACARVRSAGAHIAKRGTVIAIKTMKKTFESFAPCLELREVVFLRTLSPHQHLVPALDIFLDPFSKKLHICMEYMDGNLYQLMKARDHKHLDVGSVKSILFQIMLGLEHIHAHYFFHRDIKPENILVSTSSHQETGTAFRRYSAIVTPPATPLSYIVKIADFGLARETHSKLPYTTYVSTRWYRAPEVLLRAGEYSAPVDIWAIGAMAVEIATLKPLFPGGNEVDQVWRVCEIMGSPGNWYNKADNRVGGGEWREGTRLAGNLGFSFPKMAPHSMDTILIAPQWPAALSDLITWCLMWDPKSRPTSTQALAHEFFVDAFDPLRPKLSTSRILGRKQSDLSYRGSKDLSESTSASSSKPSWFRKSLIGRTDPQGTSPIQGPGKENIAPRQSPMLSTMVNDAHPHKARSNAGKRSTWTYGPLNMAPMPILPTVKPVSPLSDAVTAQASNRTSSYSDAYVTNGHQSGATEGNVSKKIGRQLSVASNGSHYAEFHRQQAEAALNGNSGLASPPNGQKESFFSHLRKRARRFSGRQSQTPISPKSLDVEALVGCGPWSSNRSSMALDNNQLPSPVQKVESYEALDKALRNVQQNLGSSQTSTPMPTQHAVDVDAGLKRHPSLPKQQARSVDNLRAVPPISTRSRRLQQLPQGAARYETPDEEDELLDEVLSSTRKVMRRMERNALPLEGRQPLRQSTSNMTISNPYPTPSPSANSRNVLFAHGESTPTPKRSVKQTSTPPYSVEDNEWAASAAASIFAAQNRF